MAIDATGFQQQDSVFSVLAEAMRKNTSGRSRADNDVVELAHEGPLFADPDIGTDALVAKGPSGSSVLHRGVLRFRRNAH